ncbi:MAG: transporter [Burkholderiales bacterium]
MRSGSLRVGLVAFALSFCVAGADAQEAADAPSQDMRVQDLERKLEERDKVIIELLERVEALEQRVGVEPHTNETAEAPAGDDGPGTDVISTEPSEDAPGAVVVEEGAAERALERTLTLQGALLLPSGVLEIEPGFTYGRREDATPTLVTSSGTVFAGQTQLNANSLTGDLVVRLGLPWESQLELGIPYRWRQVESVTSVDFVPTEASSQSGQGVGDVRVGLAKTLLREGLWQPDLVGRVTWDTATGDTVDNGVFLGGGFDEISASLTAIKRQDPVAFVGGLGYEYTFEDEQVQPGPIVSANFSGDIALSPETSLRLLLFGAYQQETEFFGRKVSGSDQTIGVLGVGGSMLLSRGILLDLLVGVGLTEDADDFSVSLSLPIRFRRPIF